MFRQKGFTLIELVVVMVLLGILSAFAISRFYNFSSQANTADVNGLLGALNSASVTAHGAALASNKTSDGTGTVQSIVMEGNTVYLVYGYPSSGTGTNPGINNAVNVSIGTTSGTFAYTPAGSATGTATWTLNGATTPANCGVTYTPPTSAGASPTITATTTGC